MGLLQASLRASFLLLLLTRSAFAADSSCSGASSSDPAESDSDSGMCSFPPQTAGSSGLDPASASAASPVPDSGASLLLYGSPTSTCTRRVLLALLEKGLTDFKFKHLNLAQGDQKDPEYKKLQPYGQIPVLQDLANNLTLFESRAIARYIAEEYEAQGNPLLGTTLEERALVNVWFESESQEFNPHAGVIAFEMVIAARYGKKADKGRVEEAAKKLATVLDVYEERLEGREYLAGPRVSMADLSHIPYMAHLWPAGYGALVEERPNVQEWWERLTSRASWRRILDGIP